MGKKVITLTKHNRRTNSAMNQSEFKENSGNRHKAREKMAGKRVRPSQDWKVARVLLTNHRTQQSKTKAKGDLLWVYN